MKGFCIGIGIGLASVAIVVGVGLLAEFCANRGYGVYFAIGLVTLMVLGSGIYGAKTL